MHMIDNILLCFYFYSRYKFPSDNVNCWNSYNILILLWLLQDWRCIISMLLDQNPQIEPINDEDSTNLIRLLFASVRKAVGERIVPTTDNRKQYHSKAQRVSFCLSSFFLNRLHSKKSIVLMN